MTDAKKRSQQAKKSSAGGKRTRKNLHEGGLCYKKKTDEGKGKKIGTPG